MSSQGQTAPKAPPQRRDSDPPWNERCFLAAAAVVLALAVYYYVSRYWGHWGSFNVDFGRELYIPWQILHGKALYRDIAHINGPLSQYANAVILYVFGETVSVLQIANVGVAALTGWLVWLLAAALASRPVAAVAVVAFALLSVFSHDPQIGIFSYIAPYSHEITHGLLLGFAGLVLLHSHLLRPSRRKLFFLGGVMGLALLTKPEIALAVHAAIATGLFLAILQAREGVAKGLARLAPVGLGWAIPVALAVVGLSLRTSFEEAVSGMTRMWRMALDPRISGNEFYRKVLGVKYQTFSLASVRQSLLFHGLSVCYVALFAQAGRVSSRWRGVLGYALIVAATVLVGDWIPPGFKAINALQWTAAWPLLLTVLAAVLFVLAALGRRRNVDPGFITFTSLVVFALCLVLKIYFNARFLHYGNYLLVPCLVVYSIGLLYYFPRLLGGSDTVRRCAFLCGLIVLCYAIAPRVEMSNKQLALKNIPVHSPYGVLYGDDSAHAVQGLLDDLAQRTRPGQTLAVIPEGAMLNFLSGLPNSTPYINLMPPEWTTFGGSAILRAYEANPPDWLCCIQTNVRFYGLGPFEDSYGADFFQFIEKNYTQTGFYQDAAFYAVLYKRKSFP